MTELTRKERDQIRRREEILLAALSVFSEKGFYGTTMAQISQAAEYPLGTIYKFFPGKEQIFHDMVMDRGTRLGTLIGEIAGREELSPEERIHECLRKSASFLKDNKEFMRVYISLRSSIDVILSPELSRNINRLHERMIRLYTSLFEEGIEKGEFRNYKPDEMAALLNGLIFSSVWPWLSGETDIYDVEAWLETAFKMVTRGIKPVG